MNSYIKKLTLTNYRVYENSVFEWIPNINIIYGENGIGKTNILEAISFLSAGKGFFNSPIIDVLRKADDKMILNNWTIRAEIENNIDYDEISIYSENENNNLKKKIRINKNLVRSQETLMKIFNIIYLIPEMQNLFIGEKENRRKFLDKIVYLIDTEHAKRLAKYEYLIKERMRILQQEKVNFNENWILIIERKIAENAVAIASARSKIVYELNNIIYEYEFNFPKFVLLIDGIIENMILKNRNAIDIENEFRETLKNNRELDKESKRTNEGVHKSDLKLFYQKKNMYAENCSTGEQKLFLISLTILKVLLCKKKNKATPIILLDEVFSYLDKTKKIELFNELQKLNYQTFITSTDISIFDNLINKNTFTLNLNEYKK